MKPKKDILKTKYLTVHHIDNLRDLVYQSANLYKNNSAFKLKNNSGEIYGIKYIDFKNDVEALGTSLIDLGLTNQAISLIGKNSYSWIISYIASSVVGTVVPIDKELHSDDIINFINISNSKAVICDEKHFKCIYDNKTALHHDVIFIVMNTSSNFSNASCLQDLLKIGHSKVSNGITSFKDIKIDPDKMHILLFTSGTTGTAKGICLSHKNICSNIMSVAQVVKVDTSTVVLSILPVHHTYECTLGELLPLYGGGTITYCDGLRYISQNINEYKPSFLICVPLLLKNIYKKILKTLMQNLPKKYFSNDKHFMDNMPVFLRFFVKRKVKKSLGGNLKTFIFGAAPIEPSIVESFCKLGFNALQGYGLTECSPLVAGNNDFFYKSDSVGLPIPNVEYKIYNPNENGVGEIIVKGPNVMLGYYNDIESTNKAFKDGYFHTGDLGYIDTDGFLYITGRCKNVIIAENGKNVYPEEIEFHLNDNPLVKECIILGVLNKKNHRMSITAKIFPDIDAFKKLLQKDIISSIDMELEFRKIILEINSKLPKYKHIKDFKIVEKEFEKTTTQKIKRYGNNLNV